MEESVNFVNTVKGYNKINPSDAERNAVKSQSPSPTRRRTTVTVTLTIVAIIIIIAGIVAATTVHRRHTQPSQPNQSQSLNSSESIKTVCAVTQHPDTCYTDIVNSISSVNSVNAVNDPVTIFNLTLQLTLTELTNVSSLPKTLISNSNDLRTGGALRDCANLFDDAVSQLGRSAELMMKSGELTRSVLTVEKVRDMMTWISGAMTDLETCVDGLEEMGSTAVDEVKAKVQRSNVWMSNSLAILGHMEDIFSKFGLHLN